MVAYTVNIHLYFWRQDGGGPLPGPPIKVLNAGQLEIMDELRDNLAQLVYDDINIRDDLMPIVRATLAAKRADGTILNTDDIENEDGFNIEVNNDENTLTVNVMVHTARERVMPGRIGGTRRRHRRRHHRRYRRATTKRARTVSRKQRKHRTK